MLKGLCEICGCDEACVFLVKVLERIEENFIRYYSFPIQGREYEFSVVETTLVQVVNRIDDS